uniref:Facilitated trehalose transporter Tret1 n=3 Tax=Lygus hesperus TaxID=30085 RepID=A0A146LVQ5_LYGHE
MNRKHQCQHCDSLGSAPSSKITGKKTVRYSLQDSKDVSEQLELPVDHKEMTMEQAIETGKGFAKDKTQHKRLRIFLAQVLAACSKYLTLLDIGMAVTFAAVANPPLLKGEGGIKITQDEASWIASLVFVWQPVGSMTTVALSKFGRKTAMIYLQIPLLLGWILPYFATTVWELYLAASIMGLGVGFVQAPIATYIGEVTQPQYRGALASVAYFMFTLGQAVIFGIDVITGDWRKSAIISSIIPVLTAVHLFFIPESPMWLISKGRYDEAKLALRWLRGWTSEEEVDQEFKDLLYHNCEQYAELCCEEGRVEMKGLSGQIIHHPDMKDFTSKQSIRTSGAMSESDKMPWAQKYFLRPEMYNPIIFTVLFMYLSNGSGLGAFRSYLIFILETFHIEMNEAKASVGVIIVGLLGTVLMVTLIPIIGKRKLTFVSVTMTALGCLSLGVYIIFKDQINSKWIPIVILVEILFASNLGVSHIPWIQISEIFPLKGKTFGTGLVAGLGNVLQFIGTKLFYTYMSWLTLGGVFIMYAVTYIIGLVYLYFYQVETEGRPLNDIVDDFKRRRRDR